tara:strand:- start:20 stop:238 length:219 start_codon:yes stop_codon:yes gene_type:complete
MTSIENLCKCQQNIADRIFMDFKYTHAGSTEQISALNSFHLSIGLWAVFLENTQMIVANNNLDVIPTQSRIY